MIIFLDFDGVLHPLLAKHEEHFSCLPRLATVLRDFPDTMIVISSTWRLTRTLEALRRIFPEDIQARVVGVTPTEEYSDQPGAREKEILSWLEKEAPNSNWLAIDDYAPAFFSLWNVVLCQNGFGPLEEHELRERLTEDRTTISSSTARIMTVDELAALVPTQHKRYVRAEDIPEPYRSEFISDSRGSTRPVIEDEASACFYVWDWELWLSYRLESGYHPRFGH